MLSPKTAKIRIALTGRSGAGKSTVAEYLKNTYHFSICKTGIRCRSLAKEFFNTESKTILNELTDAMRKIDPTVWLRMALNSMDISNPYIVIDSIRFVEDYTFAKVNGYYIWRINAPLQIRVRRLASRGQEYDMSNDEQHLTEKALEELPVDESIENGVDSLPSLYRIIDQKINLYSG
jgi:dephospho-CoA kinase